MVHVTWDEQWKYKADTLLHPLSETQHNKSPGFVATWNYTLLIPLLMKKKTRGYVELHVIDTIVNEEKYRL